MGRLMDWAEGLEPLWVSLVVTSTLLASAVFLLVGFVALTLAYGLIIPLTTLGPIFLVAWYIALFKQ